MDEEPKISEYYVETRQVVYRDCRVLATSEAEAKALVREGKAGMVEIRPTQTHKVTNVWPLAAESCKLLAPSLEQE